MFQYRAHGGAIFADFLARQQTDRFSGRGRSEAEVVYRHRGGGIVRGHLGRSVGFRMAFEQVREQGSRVVTPTVTTCTSGGLTCPN